METGKANKIIARTFKIDYSTRCHLAVQIGLNHLSYCVTNNNTNNVEYLNSFSVNNDLTHIISKEEILNKDFASKSVAYTNFASTLVPHNLFEEQYQKEILDFNTRPHDIIRSDRLSRTDAQLIYSIPKDMADIVSAFFPNTQQKARESIFIDQVSQFDNKHDNAYLYISENNITITIFKNTKLRFSNRFYFETKEDILYFTLFTFEQLKINTETVQTKLYGNIIKGDENHQLLYEYIRNIEFGSRPNHLNFSSEFDPIQAHQFYSLFSQSI
tara:strand:- start:3043 stop:3858 length:816 start_codon:yes stop_codon:yes gene_type:complete